jgi:hypothetical protein
VERLGESKVVWAGGGVGVTECPKSLVTGDSLSWLEAFFTWKVMGGVAWEDMWSKQCDAFLVLEQELRKGSNP